MTDHDTPAPDFVDALLRSAFACEQTERAARAAAPAPSTAPEWLGRFRVIERIGTGGVGEVFKVVDPRLERTVALKVLHERSARDEYLSRAFFAEAQLAGSLEHPGIVPLHECGILPDGRPYFTMRIIGGRTFADELEAAEGGSAAGPRSIDILLAVAKTLAFAHSRGVVHGDLKPHNVMVGDFGEVRLIDWGFARPVRSAPTGESSALRMAGTPAYMAPEQARGDLARIDERTDVFGLGAILVEILTKAPPNVGSSRSSTVRAATIASHAELRDRLTAANAPPELARLALECLSPRPEDRPRDAAAVVTALELHLAAERERARTAELAAERANATAIMERRRRRWVVAFASAALAGLAVIGVMAFQSQSARLRRLSENDRAASRALAEVESAVARASDSVGDPSPESWELARDAARRAVEFVRGLETTTDFARVAGELESSLAREVARRRLAAATVIRLEELHHRLLDDRHGARLEREFAEIFESVGIDITRGSPAECGAKVRADLIATTLVAGLDNWARLRRSARDVEPAAWHRLVDIAIASDGDNFREAVRRALKDGDPRELESIAAQPDSMRQPAPSLLLLARSLFDLGRSEAALTVFEAACRDHPDDYWLCHDYATVLGAAPSPATAEMKRAYSMALAQRPRDPHTLVDLARVHAIDDEQGTARVLIERALEIDPAAGRAWLFRGTLDFRAGALAASREALTRARELGETSAGVLLADACLLEGRVLAARDLLAETVAEMPFDTIPRLALGKVLIDTFDFRAAAEQFDAVAKIEPGNREARLFRGFCALNLGDVESALPQIREAHRLIVAANDTQLRAQAMHLENGARLVASVAATLESMPDGAAEELYGSTRSEREVFSSLEALLCLDRADHAVRAAEALLERSGARVGFGLRFAGARAVGDRRAQIVASPRRRVDRSRRRGARTGARERRDRTRDGAPHTRLLERRARARGSFVPRIRRGRRGDRSVERCMATTRGGAICARVRRLIVARASGNGPRGGAVERDLCDQFLA